MSRKIEQLEAWTSAARLVAGTLGDWFGMPLATRCDAPAAWSPELAAQLFLTSPVAGRRLCVTLQSDAASLQAVCGILFGEGEHPAFLLEDLLREATNVAAGAIKAAALEEGVTLTTGLPSSIPLTDLHEQGVVQRFTMELPTAAGCARLSVVLCSQVARSQQRAVDSLCDGMVVARDVRDGDGDVLVRAGIRLTSTNVSLIAERLAGGELVEVALET